MIDLGAVAKSTAASVNIPGAADIAFLFIDTADGKLKYKNSAGATVAVTI